jgi:hypothetical protein
MKSANAAPGSPELHPAPHEAGVWLCRQSAAAHPPPAPPRLPALAPDGVPQVPPLACGRRRCCRCCQSCRSLPSCCHFEIHCSAICPAATATASPKDPESPLTARIPHHALQMAPPVQCKQRRLGQAHQWRRPASPPHRQTALVAAAVSAAPGPSGCAPPATLPWRQTLPWARHRQRARCALAAAPAAPQCPLPSPQPSCL